MKFSLNTKLLKIVKEIEDSGCKFRMPYHDAARHYRIGAHRLYELERAGLVVWDDVDRRMRDGRIEELKSRVSQYRNSIKKMNRMIHYLSRKRTK